MFFLLCKAQRTWREGGWGNKLEFLTLVGYIYPNRLPDPSAKTWEDDVCCLCTSVKHKCVTPWTSNPSPTMRGSCTLMFQGPSFSMSLVDQSWPQPAGLTGVSALVITVGKCKCVHVRSHFVRGKSIKHLLWPSRCLSWGWCKLFPAFH